MLRMILYIVLLLSLAVMATQGCESRAGDISGAPKDLSQQMDVLSIYQNQMGDDIRRHDFAGAEIMLDGMDSVLQEIITSINRHPSLNNPFSHYYNSKLDEPVRALKMALRSGDRENARIQYKVLVKRCNSCHNVHDVEERAHE